MDNLPVVEKINYNIGDDKVEVQTAGYNLGFIDNEDVYLNNHVSFKISYIDSNNEDDDKNNSIQIYSVEVQPKRFSFYFFLFINFFIYFFVIRINN